MSDFQQQPFQSPEPPQEPPAPQEFAAKSRLAMPAISMIIVGVIGILASIYLCLNGWIVLKDPDALIEVQREFNPNLDEMLEETGISAELYASTTGYVNLGAGLLGFFSGLLGILGGIRMMKAKSYGLAMMAAICYVIPCLQPCCLFGLPVGIWAIIVLMNADVKRAFG